MGVGQNHIAVVRTFYGSDQRFPLSFNSYWNSEGDLDDAYQETQDLADALAARLTTTFPPVLCTSSSYQGLAVSYHEGGVVYTTVSSAGSGPGTQEGDELPDYAAVVIQKRTSQPGRVGFGRWFIGAVPEAVTDTNALTNGGRDDYQALADALTDPLVVGAVTWNPSHYSGKDDAFYRIEHSNVDRYLGTQKRRQLRLAI